MTAHLSCIHPLIGVKENYAALQIDVLDKKCKKKKKRKKKKERKKSVIKNIILGMLMKEWKWM